MSYFQLPSLPYNNNIILSLNESSPNNDNNSAIIINKTLVIYLKKIKSDIENYSNEWDNTVSLPRVIYCSLFVL